MASERSASADATGRVARGGGVPPRAVTVEARENRAVHRQISPSSIAPPAARYAHAVLTHAAERWLHTSGVVPTRPDGTVPDPIGDQAEVVWANIGAMLVEAGMVPSDIVSVTTYAVVGHPLADVMAARDRFLDGHFAASTLVTVPALARPEWKMEIAIVAAS
jgi:enamine deaminase RidA (YjgF/YER057c/UK114 family)